jgi:epoxyqueuosine reductase
MNINEAIRQVLEPDCIDYLGYADLTKYQNQIAESGGDIVRNYKYGISIGIVLPDSIVDFLPQRFDNNVASAYKNHAYTIINQRLNTIASKLSSYLNRLNYKTLPIGASEITNQDDAIATISHKMIAHIAGLGWIGKNCLLITPEHGPRVRFISLLTNAPVIACDNQLKQRCNECMECVQICPVQALKGTNYEHGQKREARLNFRKCEDYFTKMKAQQTWDVCGMCLYVCPYGRSQCHCGMPLEGLQS